MHEENHVSNKDVLDDFPFSLKSIEKADIQAFDLSQEETKTSTYQVNSKDQTAVVEDLIQATFGVQEKPKEKLSPLAPPPPKTTPSPREAVSPLPSTPYERTFKDYHVGDIVKGKIVKIDAAGLFVDIGYKADGLVPPDRVANKPVDDLSQAFHKGEEIQAYIESLESKEGYVLLSKKRADLERAWEAAYSSQKNRTPFEAQVVSVVKGGLVVDFGARGFIPASQVAKLPNEKLEAFIGQTLLVKALEVDRKQGKAILSHKQATGEVKKASSDKLFQELEVGTIRRGVVRSLKKFGAFVDLGGAEGLIHISEISWNRVADPSEKLKVGDEIDVFVLGVDQENKKIALGLKQLEPDPWVEIDNLYKVGEIVKGKVARTAKFGAFISLERGLEGLCHISELSQESVKRPEDAVVIGQDVEVKILRINTEEQKIGLSLKQAQAAPPKPEETPPLASAEPHGNTPHRLTIGDALGEKLAEQIQTLGQTGPTTGAAN